MAHSCCPHCGTLLSEGFLAAAGDAFDCPECDGRVRLSIGAPGRAESADGPDQPAVLVALAEESPPGERIRCQAAADQLVIYIAPGSSRRVRGVGLFGACWTGFIAVFTGMVVLAGGVEGARALVYVPFLGVFWAVGLGVLYFWYRARFGTIYLLIEPDRLVKRFVLAGRERLREYALTHASRASLAVSYTENDRPVHCVAIAAADKAVTFGTFLTDEEKRWLVERINRHLEGAPLANDPPPEENH